MSNYETLKAAREVADMPGGIAFLRVLQAHGINQLVRRNYQTGELFECCSIDRMIEEAERS